MTLGTKIAAAISLVFVLVFGGTTTFLVLDEIEFAERGIDIHGRLLGNVVASVAGQVWEARGEAAARDLVREIDRHEERIEIGWLDITASRSRPSHSMALTDSVLRRLAEGEVVGRLSPSDENTMYTLVPVRIDGEPTRFIRIAESLAARNDHIQGMIERIAGGFVIALFVGGIAAYALGRWLVSRPVGQLIAVARSIGAGDFSARATDHERDELGHLARETNRMAIKLAHAREDLRDQEDSRRRVEEQLRHADRLATIGQLASEVAHEIGTPLQAIVSQSDVIDQKAGDSNRVRESARAIKRQSHRIAKIVRSLLRCARKATPCREPRDLRKIIQNAVTLIEGTRAKDGIDLVTRIAPEPAIASVDDEQIEQVITNLVLNGIQAMPGGGKITIGLDVRRSLSSPNASLPAADYLCLYVDDQGTGISDDARPHLFDPFFTTKPVGHGTGLGLSIVGGIVREHEGWIDVDSDPSRGSRFSVYLPVVVTERSVDSASDGSLSITERGV